MSLVEILLQLRELNSRYLLCEMDGIDDCIL